MTKRNKTSRTGRRTRFYVVKTLEFPEGEVVIFDRGHLSYKEAGQRAAKLARTMYEPHFVRMFP